ncbi:MAG: hypothetical protein ACXACY_30395 [Candidatus Hodarchaeales archaeon]|jgi:hypothetical protein
MDFNEFFKKLVQTQKDSIILTFNKEISDQLKIFKKPSATVVFDFGDKEQPLYYFLLQKAINEDNIFVLILKAHLYFDNFLEVIFKNIGGKKAKKFTKPPYYLTERINILDLFGQLSETLYIELKTLNKLRNKFAHQLDYDITTFDFKNFPELKEVIDKIHLKNNEKNKEYFRILYDFLLRNQILWLTQRLLSEHPEILKNKRKG